MPAFMGDICDQLNTGAADFDSGFDMWIDWYQNRLKGMPLGDLAFEREVASMTKERRAQSPAEINAYLRSFYKGASGSRAEKQLRRVRALFIGYGGAGKTSLVNALHGDTVVEGQQAMTKGIAVQDGKLNKFAAKSTSNTSVSPKAADIHEEAGVFTRIKHFDDQDLTVHFWDFGGQVMAHATHQFFLRSGCLYVIVLDARKERNANEEAEYWLEHVRAFGDNAPVLLVGNKADQVQVNLEMSTLKEKYPNILGFHGVSCTEAKGRYKDAFNHFANEFNEALIRLGEHGERFTEAQFKVLKSVQEAASGSDFLPQEKFDTLCADAGIASGVAGGREGLLDLFDKLGIVMHFPRLPFLTDYLLNPRWLTYGVYSIMYSEQAQAQHGRISVADVVAILKAAQLSEADETKRTYKFPPDRCGMIVDAMIAFGVAFRLARDHQRLVIPALLEPDQPTHDFKSESAMAFQLVFKGFLPRHVLPSLTVDHHMDIAEIGNRQIVWQNGVLLRPDRRRGLDAEALVRADYHDRTIDILVAGSDANAYLGHIRDSIHRTLITMPELRYEENVRLRPDMRVGSGELARVGEKAVWMSYSTIRMAQKNRIQMLPANDGIYDLDKILAVMPVSPEVRPADVFLSYAHRDRKQIERLAGFVENAGVSVWYDRDLIGSQAYRATIDQRIDTATACVVLWTEHSVGSRWVIHEASRAADQKKLICLMAPGLERSKIPAPFPANDHMLSFDDEAGLMQALRLLGVKS